MKIKYICWWLMSFCLLAGCQTTTSLKTPAQIRQTPRWVLFLDPGHGIERDQGVVKKGMAESDYVYPVCLDIKEEMERYGVTVILTRIKADGLSYFSASEQRGCSLAKRVAIIPETLTKFPLPEDRICFVSIHFNDVPVYYSGAVIITSNLLLSLAVNLQESLDEGGMLQQKYGVKFRPMLKMGGPHYKRGLYVLHHSTEQAVLVEGGNMNNPLDRAKIRSEVWQRQFAHTVVQGILKTFGIASGEK